MIKAVTPAQYARLYASLINRVAQNQITWAKVGRVLASIRVISEETNEEVSSNNVLPFLYRTFCCSHRAGQNENGVVTMP